MHCELDHIYDISNVNEAYAFFKDKFVSIFKKFGAMHFIYYINRSIATKVDSTYLGY